MSLRSKLNRILKQSSRFRSSGVQIFEKEQFKTEEELEQAVKSFEALNPGVTILIITDEPKEGADS